MRQIKSKQRVADHGEVFTADREVNAMLDLVADEFQRVDSTFLEPACGNGQFVKEILRRKLTLVQELYFGDQIMWERNAMLALSCIYGIELLLDNTKECRDGLIEIFTNAYQALSPVAHPAGDDVAGDPDDYLKSAKYVVDANIICGDALSKLTHDDHDIAFAEWKIDAAGLVSRSDCTYKSMFAETQDMFAESELPSYTPQPWRLVYQMGAGVKAAT